MTRLVLTLTLRQLLGQKRTLFLAAVGLLPVLAAVIFRAAGDGDESAAEFAAQVVLNALVINILLPLTALVLATASLGSEIEDGTIVYLLSKPAERWRIVAGKLLAAWGATAVLVLASALLSGVVALAGEGESRLLIGFLVAIAVGSLAYSSVFVLLSLVTS
ncbi:MAG: ABC transporter permease, partial [Chloroflexi bacterium]|nr:ABC transporter permease [Chloroflexota bacterium]